MTFFKDTAGWILAPMIGERVSKGVILSTNLLSTQQKVSLAR